MKFKVKGYVVLRVYRNGRLTDTIEVPNVITNVGLKQLSGLINGLVTTPFKYIAIGDGSSTSAGSCTDAAATDTALGHELKRKEATASQVTTSVTDDTAQLVATFSSADGLTGSASLCEAGVFDASTGGNMLARRTFPVINLNWDNGDSIQITWKIQVSTS